MSYLESLPEPGQEHSDAELLELFRQIIEERIPFNRLLGFKLGAFDRRAQRAELGVQLRPEHIGNSVRGMPHGGLLAALVDGASGAAAALTLDDYSLAPTVATVDMRVDFLRPATGRRLNAVATVMRSGRSVVVVRTDVFDEDGTLVVLGTSTFTVGREARA
jgi:uncharacterized protein (TIGR00369 family)